MNFPSAHPLYNTGALGNSDVILALEVEDIFMLTHRMSPINRIGIDSPVKLTHNGAKLLSISSLELFRRSNYQDFARYNEVGMAIADDGEAGADTKRMPISTLPRISGRAAVKRPNVKWFRIVCWDSFRFRRLSAAVTRPRRWARVVYHWIEYSSD
jgi:hypothetical protein